MTRVIRSPAPGGDNSAPADNDPMAGGDTTDGDTDGGDSGAPSIPRPTAIAGAAYDGWNLNFHDEFDSVDTIAANGTQATGKLWYNGTEECCISPTDGKSGAMYPTPVGDNPVDPYTVSNSVLDITAHVVSDTWTSGVLTSVDNSGQGFAQEYGYFEIRFKMSSGSGTWPAFWMLDQHSKQSSQTPAGEIDIMEVFGVTPTEMNSDVLDLGSVTPIAYKYDTNPNDPNTGQPINWTDGFHTAAMLWTADSMTFYADDQVFMTSTTPALMQAPYYLLVDLGIGGYDYSTADTPDPSVMQVDYVRVWGQ